MFACVNVGSDMAPLNVERLTNEFSRWTSFSLMAYTHSAPLGLDGSGILPFVMLVPASGLGDCWHQQCGTVTSRLSLRQSSSFVCALSYKSSSSSHDGEVPLHFARPSLLTII